LTTTYIPVSYAVGGKPLSVWVRGRPRSRRESRGRVVVAAAPPSDRLVPRAVFS